MLYAAVIMQVKAMSIRLLVKFCEIICRWSYGNTGDCSCKNCCYSFCDVCGDMCFDYWASIVILVLAMWFLFGIPLILRCS